MILFVIIVFVLAFAVGCVIFDVDPFDWDGEDF